MLSWDKLLLAVGEAGFPLNTSEEADWSSCCCKGQAGLWTFYPMRSQDRNTRLPVTSGHSKPLLGCLVTRLCLTLLPPHGLSPARLLCPWDFPGKNTRVGCHFLLQIISWTRDWMHVSCTARGLLHCRQILYWPRDQGSPDICLNIYLIYLDTLKTKQSYLPLWGTYKHTKRIYVFTHMLKVKQMKSAQSNQMENYTSNTVESTPYLPIIEMYWWIWQEW